MVSIKDIAECLEYDSSWRCYYDRDEDSIIRLCEDFDDLNEDGSQDRIDEDPERYVFIDADPYLGRRIMDSFIAMVEDRELREVMIRRTHVKGAYSNFRKLLTSNGMLDSWYEFKESCYLKEARIFCESSGIEYE